MKPIEVRQYDYGWTITCFGPDGRVRHVATADSRGQALEAAHRMIDAYHLQPTVLIARRGNHPRVVDIEHLMHDTVD